MAFSITRESDVQDLEQNLRATGKLTSVPSPASSSSPDLLVELLNDHGNACRLIALHGSRLRYCHAFKKWLVWDEMRWAVDETDQARKLAKQAMLEFLRQAIDRGNHEAEKFASRSLDSKRIASILTMAECEIFVRPSDLDTDAYLLNFRNGTVDLRTGELKPHQSSDFITKLVHYDYRPSATCPRWMAFLTQIMGGSPNGSPENQERVTRLTAYLQRAFGYSLTGCTIEKAVFVLFGAGDNGKSTMLTTFRRLIDEYSVLLQADTLMVKRESNNSQADLADLRGARFVQTSETEEGQRLGQAKLKRITQGMGKIKAIRKYENPTEFPETHKLWMDTNRKPEVNDVEDQATFNRLHPIPFTVTIPREQIDRGLTEKLLLEAEGILAWAAAGALQWHQAGLGKPYEVEEANQLWRLDNDQIGRFIAERCVLSAAVSCFSEPLYLNYRSWAETNGERKILPQKTFSSRIKNRDNIQSEHKNQGTLYFGIGLRYQE